LKSATKARTRDPAVRPEHGTAVTVGAAADSRAPAGEARRDVQADAAIVKTRAITRAVHRRPFALMVPSL